METGTEATTTTTEAITMKDVEPYLKQYSNDNTFTNGLLIFLIVYIIIKDFSNYIKSFITGGL